MALLPQQWLGQAGEQFRSTVKKISEYNEHKLHVEKKLDELPDLAWSRVKGEASEKHSRALVNFAEEEGKRIANTLSQRTADDQARAAKATADKLEAEARLTETNELMARIALVERCREIGVIPIWSKEGHMTVVKAPADCNWHELISSLLGAAKPRELKATDVNQQEASQPPS